MTDVYSRKQQLVREALDGADPEVLRAAVAELLDLQPTDQGERDEYTAAADDGWWTCHATFVAMLASKLGLETRT